MRKIRFLQIILLSLFIVISTIFVVQANADINLQGYKLPWTSGISRTITQGWDTQISHKCPSVNCYSYDFSFREGEDVLASRAGTVTFKVDGNTECGLSEFQHKANYVVINHDDNTATAYWHLKQVFVDIGEFVPQGHLIGTAGKTGWTKTKPEQACGPHLHFQREVQDSRNPLTTTLKIYFDEYPDQQFEYPNTKVSQNVRPFVELYPEPNYSMGICCEGALKSWRIYNTGFTNLPTEAHNQISSIKLPAGVNVTVYELENREGAKTTFFASDPILNDNYYDYRPDLKVDNRIRSIEIVYKPTPCTNLFVASQTSSEINSNSPDNQCIPPIITPVPPPNSGRAWQARYYDGHACWNDTNCLNQPRCTSNLDGPELHANFTGTPCNGMSGDNWVGDYKATINFPAGSYVFRLENDDGAKVWLNGQNIQERGNSSSDPICPPYNLSGDTSLRLLLREDSGEARAHLTWTTDTSLCSSNPPLAGRWQVKYYNFDKNNPSSKSECTPNSNEASFDGTYLFKDWRTSSPGGNCNQDFIAEITGRMHFEANKQYTFHLNADDAALLEVYGHKRGNLVIDRDPDDRTSPAGMTSPVESIEFWDAGEREVRLVFRDNAGDAIVQTWWEGAGLPVLPNDTRDPQQWYVEYWGNRHLWQDSLARRNEGNSTSINYRNWGTTGPGFGISTESYSARFLRSEQFQCGTYRFHLEHDDGVRFYVDNNLKIDKWADGAQANQVEMFLSPTTHELKLEYYQNTGGAGLYFTYERINTNGCLPDFAVEIPNGWSSPVSISANPGTHSNDTLIVGQPVYVDIAYKNRGQAPAVAHFVDLYIDGVRIKREWVPELAANTSKIINDLEFVYNTSGSHEVGIFIDPENVIAEDNKSNNMWSGQFIWQTVTSSACNTITQIPQTECHALEALYNSTDQVGETDNWFTTYTPCDTWAGIVCRNNHVTQLLLDDWYIHGTIAPELGNLTQLEILDLADNYALAGSIPPELGKLANLRILRLDRNSLTGGIPSELGNLTKLEELSLYTNQLSGGLPTSLSNLRNVQLFWFYDTGLCIPSDAQIQNWLNSIVDVQGTGACNAPPAMPGSVQAFALNSNQIQITWVDTSHNESQFTINEGSTTFTVPANTTSFTHSGLEPDTYHCYNLIASNEYGSSESTDWSCILTMP